MIIYKKTTSTNSNYYFNLNFQFSILTQHLYKLHLLFTLKIHTKNNTTYITIYKTHYLPKIPIPYTIITPKIPSHPHRQIKNNNT